jgi:hypothetical protein
VITASIIEANISYFNGANDLNNDHWHQRKC